MSEIFLGQITTITITIKPEDNACFHTISLRVKNRCDR